MFYSDNIQDTRQPFFSSWFNYRQKKQLQPLEKQIVDVILMHPEYHALLEGGLPADSKAYFPELGQTNPFLHMGLHLALRDQVATDRPAGIASIYQKLLKKHTHESTVEHMIMEPLAECLWQAQRTRSMPDETTYLEACRQLLL